MPPSARRGPATTEFWLSALAVVVGSLLAAGIFPACSTWERVAGVLAAALAALGYSYSRSKTKTSGP